MTLATAPTATATTFGLPAGIDVAACAGTESGRYSFNHAQVTTCSRGTWITCTDGRMASVVHLDGPTSGPAGTHLVPPSILKKATGKDRVMIALSEAGSSRTDKRGTMTLPPVDVSTPFPPIDDVMPSPESLADSVSVTLNAAYLADLAAAVGSNPTRPGIVLTIPRKAGKPIVVQGEHGFGLLMPAAGTETPIEHYAKALDAWRAARQEGGAR
jgi:hypothetical protein